MNHFVQKSFKKYGWSCEEDHNAHVKELENQRNLFEIRSEPWLYYSRLVRAARKERTFYRTRLENEWLTTQPGYLHGLRFMPRTREFYGTIRYYKVAADDKSEKEILTQKNVKIEHQWLLDCFSPEFIQAVVDLSPDHSNFFTLPKPIPWTGNNGDKDSVVKVRLQQGKPQKQFPRVRHKRKQSYLSELSEGLDVSKVSELVSSIYIPFDISVAENLPMGHIKKNGSDEPLYSNASVVYAVGTTPPAIACLGGHGYLWPSDVINTCCAMSRHQSSKLFFHLLLSHIIIP